MDACMIRRPSDSTLVAVGLILLGAAVRIARDAGWLPLPPNVAPISAMALLSGAVLPRRLTFVVPLAAMLASDLVIGFYTLPVMVAVYASFALSNILGLRLRRRLHSGRVMAASLAGSVAFFLITNAAVWAFQTMYPHTAFGLGQSYLAGLPFFRNTVLGDLLFTGILVGSYRMIMVYWQHRQSLTPAPING